MILLFSLTSIAKIATVHILVKNYKGSIDIFNPALRYELMNKVESIQLDEHYSASYKMEIDKPTFLILYFVSDKNLNCSLFISPGDELNLTADFTKNENKFMISGKGYRNNQPEIFDLTNMDTESFKGDISPNHVVAAIKNKYLLNKRILAKYIKANNPSAAFIKNATINLAYFVPAEYYEFSHNNNFGKSQLQLAKWTKVEDSLFSKTQ